MRILIVEDEEKLARNVARMFGHHLGAAVDVSVDGLDGRHLALSETYDLIVLDLMLPGADGLSILRALRAKHVATPVLLLTARDSTEDVVAGLDQGSDDYLTKPFEMPELLARVRALLRRSHGQPASTISVGRLTLDLNARRATADGQELKLRPLELGLLEHLALRRGGVASKAELTDHLYDFGAENFSNVIEVHISRLRKELQRVGAPCRITTLRGLGYRLEAGE